VENMGAVILSGGETRTIRTCSLGDARDCDATWVGKIRKRVKRITNVAPPLSRQIHSGFL